MDDNSTNPYESPGDSDDRDKNKNPHGASILKEAWRGAKFGAKITAIIVGSIAAVGCVISIGGEVFLWWSADAVYLPDPVGYFFAILRQAAGAVFAVVAFSLIGAIAGAILMAIAACIRKFVRPANDDAQ